MLSLTIAARTALLTFLLLVTGCGQTGPLFLPEETALSPEISAEVVVPLQDPNAP